MMAWNKGMLIYLPSPLFHMNDTEVESGVVEIANKNAGNMWP